MIIKELNIDVDDKETQKGVTFKDIKIPKGKRLLEPTECMFLWQYYRDKLNLDWFFVAPPEGFEVAWFYADSGRSDLDCYWNPEDSNSSVGVRFCKRLK